ncbi:hypothetical protein ABIC90_001017 [Variovorax boronicumulans]
MQVTVAAATAPSTGLGHAFEIESPKELVGHIAAVAARR